MKKYFPIFIIGIIGIIGALSFPRNVWATPTHGLKFESVFKRVEKENRLPPGLLSRMAKQESDYNPAATGTSGEIGLMQIIPRWHPGVNPYDPIESIEYAGRLMRRYYDRFGSWAKAIAAYNWGPTALQKYGLIRAPASTKKYISDVLSDIGLGSI